jgi:short-subunit dehydrogenase
LKIRILACRNSEKTMAVVKEIQEKTGNENVEFIKIDLMSLKSVKEFVDEFKSRYDHLHILMNNAGVMMCPFGLSEDGMF